MDDLFVYELLFRVSTKEDFYEAVKALAPLIRAKHEQHLVNLEARFRVYLVTGDRTGDINVYDTTTAKIEKTVINSSGKVKRLCISPDNRYLACSSGEDCVITLWNMHTWKILHTLQGHARRVSCLCFSPDGRHLVSGGYDTKVNIWDVETGKAIETISDIFQSVDHVEYSSDARYLLFRGFKEVHVWDIEKKTFIKYVVNPHFNIRCKFSSPNNHCYVYEFEDSSDTKKHKFSIRNMTDGTIREQRLPHYHLSNVASFWISPDHRYLASTSFDNTIKIAELSDFSVILTLQCKAYRGCFSPDSNHFAFYDGEFLNIWDLTLRKCLYIMHMKSEPICLQFMPYNAFL